MYKTESDDVNPGDDKCCNRVRAVRSGCGSARMGPKQVVIHADERHIKHYSAHGERGGEWEGGRVMAQTCKTESDGMNLKGDK